MLSISKWEHPSEPETIRKYSILHIGDSPSIHITIRRSAKTGQLSPPMRVSRSSGEYAIVRPLGSSIASCNNEKTKRHDYLSHARASGMCRFTGRIDAAASRRHAVSFPLEKSIPPPLFGPATDHPQKSSPRTRVLSRPPRREASDRMCARHPSFPGRCGPSAPPIRPDRGSDFRCYRSYIESRLPTRRCRARKTHLIVAAKKNFLPFIRHPVHIFF